MSTLTWAGYAVRLSFAVTAVWMMAAVTAVAFWRASAAVRHRVWSLATAAVLTLPVLIPLLPERRVLPAPPPPLAAARPAAEATAVVASPVAVAPLPISPSRPSAQVFRPGLDDGPPKQPKEAVVLRVPTRPDSAVRQRRTNWTAIGMWAWGVPAALLVVRQVVGWAAVRRLVRRSGRLRSGPARACLARMAGGSARPLRLLESPTVASPLCVGLVRPAVLLPSDWRAWPAEKLEAVLTHEWAHAARRDVLWQTLAGVAAAVYWPHPLAWVAAWRMRAERELACDDWVVRLGGAPARYAGWLVDVAAAGTGRSPAGSVAMASGRGLERRIAAVLDGRRRRLPVTRRAALTLWAMAAIMAILAGSVSPLARSRAASAPATQRSSTTKPSPGGVTLSPGDLVSVEVHGLFSPIDDAKVEMHVERDGTIPLPLTADGVRVAGLDLTDAAQAIDRKYAEAIVLRDAGAVVVLSRGGGKPFTIAPHDRVRVRVWSVKPGFNNTVETAEVEQVEEDGSIEAAGLGRVKVGGLTESAAIEALRSLYSKRATRERYLWVEVTRIGPDEVPTTAVQHPLHVTGHLTLPNGRAVAGVKVGYQAYDRQGDAVTAADGSFDIGLDGDKLGWGDLTAEVKAENAIGFAQLDGEWAEGRSATVDLVLRPARILRVRAVDGHGRPASGAWVAVPNSLGASELTTGAGGWADFRLPADLPLEFVAADKPGVGFDYALFWRKDEPHTDPYRLPPDAAGPVTLVLNGAEPVTVRTVDPTGKPLAGVTVNPWLYEKPKHGDQVNLSFVNQHFTRTTGVDGTATFDTVPGDQVGQVMFWTRLAGYCVPDRCLYDPATGGGKIDAHLVPMVHVSGTVVGSDGRPAAAATVDFDGEGYSFDRFFDHATTDAAGHFTADVNPQMYYMFLASDPAHHLASPPALRVVKDRPPARAIELRLQPATHVHGHVVVDADHRPVPHFMVEFQQTDRSYYDLPPDQQLAGGTEGRKAIDPMLPHEVWTDAAGAYEYWAGPEQYDLYPRKDPFELERHPLTIDGQRDVEVELKVPAVAVGERPYLRGRVVAAARPTVGVPEATVTTEPVEGQEAILGDSTTDRNGQFSIQRVRGDLYVAATVADRSRGGIVRVPATAPATTVPIVPTAMATGRVLDPDGRPLAGRKMYYGLDKVMLFGFAGGQVTTGPDGRFTLDGIVPQFDYRLSVVGRNADGSEANRIADAGALRAGGPGRLDLGDRRLPRPVPTTPADFAADAFNHPEPLADRLASAEAAARDGTENVLVILGSADRPSVQQMYAVWRNYSGNADLLNALDEYVTVAVDASAPGARAWADQAGVGWPAASGFTLAVLDPTDGHVLFQGSEAAVSADGSISRAGLLAFATAHHRSMPDAQQLFDAALAQAKREGKRVLVEESGAGCAWCVKLADHLRAHRASLDKGFVSVTLDRRFPHGAEVLDRIARRKEMSIPWTAVLDADGKTLITSDGPGGNIGFPGEAGGQAWWEKMLRTGNDGHVDEPDLRALVDVSPAPRP